MPITTPHLFEGLGVIAAIVVYLAGSHNAARARRKRRARRYDRQLSKLR